MTHHFFVGVDGGGTKTTVRIEDATGHLLGQETSGPANIRLSVQEAWQSIYVALNKILSPLSIPLSSDKHYFHIGVGLAGCELKDAQNAFLQQPHHFKTVLMSSDAHIACLGAHKGGDGAIIIAGTGAVGYQIQQNKITKVGGWGFPNDDEGSGAWLGLEAVRITLKCLDGRLPQSGLAELIFNHFHRDHDYLINWANQANATEYAKLAPFVIQQSQLNDSRALMLLQQAASEIDSIGSALQAAQTAPYHALPCSLVGGITPFIQPYLCESLRARLVPCKLEPSSGAILLIRHHFEGIDVNV